jgi:hypothetical protein
VTARLWVKMLRVQNFGEDFQRLHHARSFGVCTWNTVGAIRDGQVREVNSAKK